MDLPAQEKHVSRLSSAPEASCLIRQEDVPHAGWKADVYSDIKLRLSKESNFPCVFSKNAYKKKLLLFYFVENSSWGSMNLLADALREFVEISRNWDGTLETSFPLLIAFSKTAILADSVTEYQKYGWQVLQNLHELDTEVWPENVATKTDDPGWSMCFHGMPIFCNMSSPAHRSRQSRNLGRHFVIVINPRERFDVFAGNTPAGQKMRANIRSRIYNYDGLAHAPQLATYQAGGLECWQYGLPDENIKNEEQCPFSYRSGNLFTKHSKKK